MQYIYNTLSTKSVAINVGQSLLATEDADEAFVGGWEVHLGMEPKIFERLLYLQIASLGSNCENFITCSWQSVDYGRMAEILVQRAGSTDEFTRLTSITWVCTKSCLLTSDSARGVGFRGFQ